MKFSIGKYTFEFYRPRRHSPFVYGLDFHGQAREMRPFAWGDLHSIVMMITSRMGHAEWHAAAGDPTNEGGGLLLVSRMFDFVKENALAIVMALLCDGYVDIDAERVELFGQVTDDRDREWRRDVDDRWLVRVYDNVYRNTGKTRLQLMRPHLDMLDVVNNADLNLIDNYGAMGLLSPENSSNADGYTDDEEYKQLQEEYNKVHGVKFGRWALMITRRAVKYQPIELPIKALDLGAKRKAAVAGILQALDIPKELHALFESAKFLNMLEAERSMYGSAVSYWCGVMARTMVEIYGRNKVYADGVSYPANEFWFDFVGVPALQEAQEKETQRTRETVDWLLELRGRWPEKTEYIDKRINDLIDTI